MLQVFTEEQITETSQKLAKQAFEEINNLLIDKTYNTIQSFIYEHYENAKKYIEKDLINTLCEEFISDPTSYKYKKIREKLFNENKEQLSKVLTDDHIQQTITNILWGMSNTNLFDHLYKNGIAKAIIEGWGEISKDEVINKNIRSHIANLESSITRLKNRISDLENQ